MAYVRLSSMPSQRKTVTAAFPRLDGGLNLRDAPVNLKSNESPDMENLWWENGVLRARPGLVTVADKPTNAGSGDCAALSAYDGTYYGFSFVHLKCGLCWFSASGAYSKLTVTGPDGQQETPPDNAGTFFQFGDWLYYKNRGGFYRILYHTEDTENGTIQWFTAESVLNPVDSRETAKLFTPTILINADPLTAGGDIYQPENRLNPQKRVTYNAAALEQAAYANAFFEETATGDSSSAYEEVLTVTGLKAVTAVYVNGREVPANNVKTNLKTGAVTIEPGETLDGVEAGDSFQITILYQVEDGQAVYTLPVRDVDSVGPVVVDGKTLDEITEENPGGDYSVDLTQGTVQFVTAPPVTDPPSNNTVEITYSKANADAQQAIMDCNVAAVYGSGTQVAIVLAGATKQPNAVFWSGNHNLGLDATYWPIEHYNLLGDSEDAVAQFGTQYGQLLAFKRRSVGKLALSFETVNERSAISLTYERVNDRIGCDLPGSVQLVRNNLLFANTSGGVFRVESMSAAYENNIVPVSQKINGDETSLPSRANAGLLHDLRTARKNGVTSMDDGEHYWLLANNHVWLLDYSLDTPAWFYFTGFSNVTAFFRLENMGYALRLNGSIQRLDPDAMRESQNAIVKHYQFPPVTFGSYDRLKDVRDVILSAPSDLTAHVTLIYETDHEIRTDKVSLSVTGWTDDSDRERGVSRYSAVFRRRPMCRHVRHFSLRLENNHIDEDLAIYGAEIHARFSAKDR